MLSFNERTVVGNNEPAIYVLFYSLDMQMFYIVYYLTNTSRELWFWSFSTFENTYESLNMMHYGMSIFVFLKVFMSAPGNDEVFSYMYIKMQC